MRKIIFTLILLLLLFINGCVNKPIDNEVINEEITDEKEEVSEEKTNIITSLKDFTSDQLKTIQITEKDGDRILIDDNLSSIGIISDREAILPDNNYKTVRCSSNALYCDGFDDGYDKNLIKDNISEMGYKYFDNFESPYDLTKSDTTLIFDEYDDSAFKIKDIIYGYSVENITLNGFVHWNANYTFDFIVDPAYMHGLPVYHSDSSLGEFTINDLKIKSDTLNFTVSGVNENLKETLGTLDSAYVYAQITFKNINCIYGINSGYNSTASVKNYKLLTKDTEKVLTRTFLFDKTESKDPEMVNVYNTLMSNMDIINTDLTLGITLLDLDFDKTPEVLVSKFSTNINIDFGNEENEVADVDVYRIENEKLIYIDTLYNYHTVIYELGNILGLKTLDNGSKAWFNMSYKNRDTNKTSDTDYLFTLNGNELKFQEIFGIDDGGNYRYLGKTMVFGEEPFIDERDGFESIKYSWGDYKSVFGKWEIIGKIKQGYCDDMKESSFNLYSDWLSHTEPYNKSYKLPLTDRMMSYNVAYLVDSFYLGSYNPNKQYFEYRFLGDYAKPVIYLYPTVQTDVSVKLNFNGKLTCTYPEYNDGWNVTANPDGTLINKADGREYSYLYWEGKGDANWDFSRGFVVKGKDTVKFLQEKLEYLGLTVRELNEFIVYWLPLMKQNKYNLITFQTTQYENNAKLEILPKPDSVLRVFMAYKPLDKYVEITEQKLSPFNRNGFTAVEWGGTEVK